MRHQITLTFGRLMVPIALVGCMQGEPFELAGPGEIEGEIEAYIVDYDDGFHEEQYILRVADDEEIELDLSSSLELPPLSTGDHVAVRGARVGGRLVVDSLRFLASDDDVGRAVQALSGNPTELRSRAVALLVHWGNQDGMTPETLEQRLFSAANATSVWKKEASFNILELTGDVYGWFRIAAPTGCDSRAIATRARDAATNAGIDLGQYTHILYYFPRISACSWSGRASLGRPKRPAQDSWYNGSSGCTVLAHELLHNYGAQHSRSYTCSGQRAVAAPGNCTYSEYGDRFDIMGGGCFHTNAHQKSAQGWFGGCNVVNVNGNGTFDIVPTQIPTNETQGLRIPADSRLCPSGMSSCSYSVEYRQPIGNIEGSNRNTGHYSGVLVHLVPPADFSGNSRPSNHPYLLDMHPATSTFNDAALLPGETFEDPYGVRITLVSADGQAAQVRVERPSGVTGDATCIDGSTPGPRDTTPPVVTLISPEDGAVFVPDSVVQMTASVVDDVAVSKAELLLTLGNESWTVDCAAAEPPFACTSSGDTYTWWVPVGPDGPGTWTVRGTDTAGNMTTGNERALVIRDMPDPCESVVCVAAGPCREAGTCDPATGSCSSPSMPDGTPCSGGTCSAGSCVPDAAPTGQDGPSGHEVDGGFAPGPSPWPDPSGSAEGAPAAEVIGGCGCRVSDLRQEMPSGILVLLALFAAARTRRRPRIRARLGAIPSRIGPVSPHRKDR